MDNNYNVNPENTENRMDFNENCYGNYETYDMDRNKNDIQEERMPKKKRKGLKIFLIGALSLCLVGTSAGVGVYVGKKLSPKEQMEEVKLTTLVQENNKIGMEEKGEKISPTIGVTGETNTQIHTTPYDVSEVVENVMPAIVSISNVYDVTENFWGQRFSNQNGGDGSGIIIGQNKNEILIVTNNHVSEAKEGAENHKITVTFNDEKTAEATIKGADASSDLAVISVKIKDISKETLAKIKVATLGDSTKSKVGQMVIAIGNALGYGQSTTVGYVSALDREVVTEDNTMRLLQTDAAINPGNSGGALLNIKGEVIGINTIKYASSKIEGMGFAIPISTAVPIINDLMNREVIAEGEQSYLGIMGQDVTESLNQVYGIPVGVYVAKVTKNSPASKAGLKMGDIITGFNSYKIKTMVELQQKLATVKAGKVVEITIQEYKDGDYKEKKIPVTLGKRSELKEEGSKEKKRGGSRRRIPENRERDFFSEDDPFRFFFNP